MVKIEGQLGHLSKQSVDNNFSFVKGKHTTSIPSNVLDPNSQFSVHCLRRPPGSRHCCIIGHETASSPAVSLVCMVISINNTYSLLKWPRQPTSSSLRYPSVFLVHWTSRHDHQRSLISAPFDLQTSTRAQAKKQCLPFLFPSSSFGTTVPDLPWPPPTHTHTHTSIHTHPYTHTHTHPSTSLSPPWNRNGPPLLHRGTAVLWSTKSTRSIHVAHIHTEQYPTV